MTTKTTTATAPTTLELIADIASMVTRLASDTLNARPVTRNGLHDAEKLVLAAGEVLCALRTEHQPRQAEPKRRRTSSARRRGGAHG